VRGGRSRSRRVYLEILAVGLCAILASAAPAVGQTSTQTSGDTTDKIKSYSVDKKNEAVAYGKKLVSDLDVKIKQLETQVSKDTAAVKADAQRELKELKSKRAEASKKLNDLGRATAQSWDATKQGFADAYKDLQQAYDKAVANLKK
jgi:signal transduction protein with GAF and PtsI domain